MAANPKAEVVLIRPRTTVITACSLAVFIAVFDYLEGRGPEFVGLLIGPPLFAAIFVRARYVVLIGTFSLVLATLIGFQAPEPLSRNQVVRLIAIAFTTGVAAAISILRERASHRVAVLSELALVAQQAVLRPIGPQVGGLSVAVRYVSASAEADIGGDLYEALDTDYGVRLLIGDVRGKGLDAVRLASTVLGSYRYVAHERPDLQEVVSGLDRAVARSVGVEDFVTACFLEERDGMLTVLNCGHPSPLLLRRGEVIPLDPTAPAPPLGLSPDPQPYVTRLEPGDRILLFTDGLTEARRDREFFPVQERAWRILGHGTVEDGLTALENALKNWVQGVLDDDIALVLIEYSGARDSSPRVAPAWKWDRARSG